MTPLSRFASHASVATDARNPSVVIPAFKVISLLLAVAAVFWLLDQFLQRLMSTPSAHVMILILVAAGIGYVIGITVYRARLLPLHEALFDAQEGILKPVEPHSTDDRFLATLYRDYNETVTTLGSMFALVEQCQTRMLAERDRMNIIVQSLPASLIGVDDDLCIDLVNRQAEELFSVKSETLAGRSLFEYLKVSDTDRDTLRDAFLYKYNIRNQVIRLISQGRETWMSINLSFLTQREGDMTAVITLLDITDYKQLQETVYNREKLVAMGQLAAGVAHELNTPLGTILGNAQLLNTLTAAPAEMYEGVKIITDEARRCSGIIQNLLNFARKENCQEGYCEVNALVKDVVSTFVSCQLVRNRIKVDCDLDPARPVASNTCGELDIVVTNLILNAMHALKHVENPNIRITTRSKNKYTITIAVEDNGPGVPTDVRARIFEPFFTTKDVGDGSGLGLSISQALLTRRGGAIRYDADHSGGARFLVTLPSFTDRIPEPESK